jgi:hypothetical protein
MACIIPHDRMPLTRNKGLILHNKADDTTVLLGHPYPQSVSQFTRKRIEEGNFVRHRTPGGIVSSYEGDEPLKLRSLAWEWKA